jgi:hypothetical protein
MRLRNFAASCVIFVMAGTANPASLHAQAEKTTWDNLQLVKSSRSARLYLLPGADFRPYSKIMLDPIEVAFRKNWVRDYNQSVQLSSRISDDRANQALRDVSTGFAEIFKEEYQKAGYQVVQQPGPDVLRVRMGVIDLSVSAPDVRSAGRSYSASWEAGEATLVVEARDSSTNALLGRALDRRLAGDNMPYLRNSSTNRANFTALFRNWAKASLEGLGRLKAGSPGSTKG